MKCEQCRFLAKFTNDKGNWITLCEAEDADEEDEGQYKVTVIDTSVFDAEDCTMFKRKKKNKKKVKE